MLIGILALGTIGFWIFLCAFTVLFWCLLENEKHGWATFSMALGLVAFSYLGSFNIVALAKTNPVAFLSLIVGYFAVGALWSVIKWWFHVTKMARRYKEMKSDWMAGVNKTNPGTFIPGQALTAEQRDRFHRGSTASMYATRPRAKKNKSKIMTWMILLALELHLDNDQ